MSIEFDSQPRVHLKTPHEMQPAETKFASGLRQPIFWALASNQIDNIFSAFNQAGIDEETSVLAIPTISTFVPSVSVTRDQDNSGEILITSKSLVQPSKRESELRVKFAREDTESDDGGVAAGLAYIVCVRSNYSLRSGRLTSRERLASDNEGRFVGTLSPVSVLIGLERAVMARGMLKRPSAHQVEL